MEIADPVSINMDGSREPTTSAGEPSSEDKVNEDAGDEAPAETMKFFNINAVSCNLSEKGFDNTSTSLR
jgi:hypothetical protein